MISRSMLARMTTNASVQRPDADQHRAVVETVGLFDRSERGKLSVTGDEAAAFLDSLLSNDVKSLEVGSGCYATLLTHKGRMLADVRVLRTADGVWLDTERPGLQALFDALRQFRIGYRAELHKQTLQRGLLSLIGPEADALVPSPPRPQEHANAPATLAGTEVLVVRTDAGLDLICAAEELAALRAGLERPGPCRSTRRRSSACESSADGPASGSTWTRRRCPRRRRSTSAPSATPRAATSARRRSPASTGRASRTATSAACGSRPRPPPEPPCTSAERRSASWPASPSPPSTGRSPSPSSGERPPPATSSKSARTARSPRP